MNSNTKITYGAATKALREEGLDWEAPAVDICDTLLYAGFDLDDIECVAMGWLR